MSHLTLWLVRHGESTANIGVWNSQPECIALTEKGKIQALEVAKKVDKKPDMIIVSPFSRAQATAEPLISRWPDVALEIWPIQEFTYLSSEKYKDATRLQRRTAIMRYWKRLDPFFCDGEGAESFSDFIKRVKNFHERLLSKTGYLVVFGHGQFFKAYLFGLDRGFFATPAWMEQFRAEETQNPLRNGEIIKLVV